MALAQFAVALVGATFIINVIHTSWRHRQKAKQLGCQSMPMAPAKDPLAITNILEMIKADKEKRVPELLEERIEEMTKIQGKYSTTYRLKKGFSENIVTFDTKNIQAILATQFKDFCIGAEREGCMGPLLGRGIFTTDGSEWSHSRAMLRPQFTRDQISNLNLEETHVQNAMRIIPKSNEKGWTDVDVQTIFFRLTLDSATEMLFGESCNCQLSALESQTNGTSPTDFSKYFDRAQWYLAQRLRLPALSFLYNTKEFKECCTEVHKFVDDCVAKALDPNKKKVEEEDENYIFLHALAATTKDPLELRSQLLNVLLAGRDTTASLLSWTMLMLARHPESFKRLRRDIIEAFGTYESPRDITFANLKSCQYLQHVMNEVLRLFPPLPMNARYATKDTSLPRGGGDDAQSPVYVRKGQAVLYSAHILHRRKDVWGEDAGEFNPDRWNGRRIGWEYLPFNGGPRICIGQQFALTEAGYVLVRFLQRFDKMEEVYPERKITWGLALVSAPGENVTVRLHEASSDE